MNCVEYLMVGVIAAVLFYVFPFAAVEVLTERECLKYGYPRAQISVMFERYCTKRIEQTDYVIPLVAARNGQAASVRQ